MATEQAVRTRHGKPVLYADEPLWLTPMPIDEASATPKDHRNCVFARCIQRTMPNVVSVQVNKTRAWIEYKTHWVEYGLTETAARELVVFDRGGSFDVASGQTYKFRVLSESARTDKRQGKISGSGNGQTDTAKHITGNMRILIGSD